MEADWLGIVMRWIHLYAVAVAVGGTVFMRVALLPAASLLGSEDHDRLREAIRKHWGRVLHPTIAAILISGLYNIAVITMRYDVPRPYYHMLFGIKFLLALGLFYVASMLMGRSSGAQRFRQNMRGWLSVNLALVVVILALSVGLGKMTKTPKAEPVKLPPNTTTEP